MNRIAPLIFFAAGSLVLAQQPSPDSTGGWRRVGTPPPASAPAATDNPAQDPEPVEPAPPPQLNDQGAPGDDALTSPAPPPEAFPPQGPPPQGAAAQQQQVYGVPAVLTVRPGTYVAVRINQPLSSDRNHEGDPFTATLMQPVVVDGIVVAQRGQTVYGRVAEAEKAHTDRPSRLRLELTSVTLADGTQVGIQSQLVTRQGGTTPAGVQAGTIVGTTAIGAAIGGAAAWGTGAALGGGIGAAAGIIGVLATRHHPTVVYPETALTFQVTTPVTVATDRAPQAFRYVGPQDYQQQQMYASRPAGPAYARPVYAAPYPYYSYPYYYGYPYYGWGPSIGVYFGRGGYWGGGYRGGYRRWR
jgi:hypothetical protein